MSAPNFALDSPTRRRLGYELIDIIDRYFESLPTRNIQLPLEKRSFEPLTEVLPESGVLDEFESDSTHAASDDKLADLYGGVLGLPVSFIIDREGRIQARHLGATNVSVFDSEVRDLLAKH